MLLFVINSFCKSCFDSLSILSLSMLITCYFAAMIRILYFLAVSIAAASAVSHDYCIVGAGPGGLQLAYFLKHSKSDYVVFERHSGPGAFFEVCFENGRVCIRCFCVSAEVSNSPQTNQHQ